MTKEIEVYADWIGLAGPVYIGRLTAQSIRGKEVFSFNYIISRNLGLKVILPRFVVV
jgi:hypothetical protein